MIQQYKDVICNIGPIIQRSKLKVTVIKLYIIISTKLGICACSSSVGKIATQTGIQITAAAFTM